MCLKDQFIIELMGKGLLSLLLRSWTVGGAMRKHNRWPSLNRKRVSTASQALSPICKVNTLLLLTFNCYTVNDQHLTTVRYYSAPYTDLYCSGNAVTFYDVVTKQRLRPGACLFSAWLTGRHSFLWFFFTLCGFYGVQWFVYKMTRVHSDNAIGFLQVFIYIPRTTDSNHCRHWYSLWPVLPILSATLTH